MDKSTNGEARPGETERPQESGTASPGRGGRMSRQRKTAAVLRLLRGEDLETVSRSVGVTAATLSGWRDAFLAAGDPRPRLPPTSKSTPRPTPGPRTGAKIPGTHCHPQFRGGPKGRRIRH